MRTRFTLKTRFTLVAAGAAVAVALAITAVAFLAIRTDLQNQVREEIAARADNVQHLAAKYRGHLPDDWVPPHSAGFGIATYTQIITATGGVWAPRAISSCSRRPRRPSTWRPAAGARITPSRGSTGAARWCSPRPSPRPGHAGGRAADRDGSGGRERRYDARRAQRGWRPGGYRARLGGRQDGARARRQARERRRGGHPDR